MELGVELELGKNKLSLHKRLNNNQLIFGNNNNNTC